MLTRVRAAVLTAGLAAAALAWAPPGASAAPGGGGSCGASGYQWGYGVACESGTATTGTPGRGRPATSGAVSTPCALYPVAGNPAQMLRVCPHGLLTTGKFAVHLLNATTTVVPAGGAAAAPVTPQQLLAWAQAPARAVHVLLSKADQLPRVAARECLQHTQQQLGALASVQLFSAHAGTGVADARVLLQQWLRAPRDAA